MRGAMALALAYLSTSAPLAAQVVIDTVRRGPERETAVEHIGTATVSRASGGTVQISRGLNTVSARSTLQLEWLMVSDSSLGLVFDGPVGARGAFQEGWFRYNVDVRVVALVAVAAFEVRVLTFNTWGDFTGTLSFTQLEDLKSSQKKSFDRVWGAYGEATLREHLTSITWVARVRTADGKMIEADPTPALKAAQKIQATIRLQDLTPKAEPVPGLRIS